MPGDPSYFIKFLGGKEASCCGAYARPLPMTRRVEEFVEDMVSRNFKIYSEVMSRIGEGKKDFLRAAVYV